MRDAGRSLESSLVMGGFSYQFPRPFNSVRVLTRDQAGGLALVQRIRTRRRVSATGSFS